MKIYEIYRYGRWMREIRGEESDLLQWVRDNVPANSETGIREGSLDSPQTKKILYNDLKVHNYEVKTRRYYNDKAKD